LFSEVESPAIAAAGACNGLALLPHVAATALAAATEDALTPPWAGPGEEKNIFRVDKALEIKT